ncbi:hypothetical protein [Serratia proteamaculans]|uniref:hypothetical protein n=1 Tax=Serratia proteamaculans TaxID=28151 RepID=UPI002178080E|nr:hypothetical protein [Serratia proteamaculans]CAI1137838.1 Uncharacterised protein [Serratia proteamaculans]CAI1173592.1 Uncharacterised protein [Serratia proteamaculans]
MQNISFHQALVHDYPIDFEFDGFSYKIKESFKKHNITLVSNFSFGSGNNGLPPELPRIQLNDENGHYAISMSLRKVDFKVDCSTFEFLFSKFKMLAEEILNVLQELGVSPFKRSVATSIIFPMDEPVPYIRKHLLNRSNAFFDSPLTVSYSLTMTDAVEYEKGFAVLRITSVSDAYRPKDDGENERFVHVYREINNFPTEETEKTISFDRFMEVGAENFSEDAIKSAIGME